MRTVLIKITAFIKWFEWSPFLATAFALNIVLPFGTVDIADGDFWIVLFIAFIMSLPFNHVKLIENINKEVERSKSKQVQEKL